MDQGCASNQLSIQWQDNRTKSPAAIIFLTVYIYESIAAWIESPSWCADSSPAFGCQMAVASGADFAGGDAGTKPLCCPATGLAE